MINYFPIFPIVIKKLTFPVSRDVLLTIFSHNFFGRHYIIQKSFALKFFSKVIERSTIEGKIYIKSSLPKVFCKKSVVKIQGKTPVPESLSPVTLFKKRLALWHKCFHASFAKFLRMPFL